MGSSLENELDTDLTFKYFVKADNKRDVFRCKALIDVTQIIPGVDVNDIHCAVVCGKSERTLLILDYIGRKGIYKIRNSKLNAVVADDTYRYAQRIVEEYNNAVNEGLGK